MIKIPIFWHNDSTEQLEEMGIDYSLSDCPVQDFYFHAIGATTQLVQEGNYYTIIYSGGVNFTSPLPIEEVHKLMQDGKV